MARASISRKKKKATVSNARKSVMAEQAKVGFEVTNWAEVSAESFDERVMETLRHYNYFYDHKEAFRWAVAWVKQNKDRQTVKYFLAAPDQMFSITVCGLCKMMLNGAVFSDQRMQFINRHVDQQVQRGKTKVDQLAKKKVVDVVKKSPADIVKERTSDFIAEVDQTLDMFGGDVYIDWDNYSIYNELQNVGAAYNTAKSVVDYYSPIRDEVKELVEKKTEDLVEAYSWLGVRKRKQYLKVIQSIIDDAEKYMMSKKAVRKTRARKSTPATKQVNKIKYMPNSAEYKLASVDPVNIIGASEVYLFNTKYRTITYLVTQSRKGFEVKGTTIHGIDLEASFKKKIRDPEQFFSGFSKATKARARKLTRDLKTKPGACNGRVNDQTIIVKVY